MSDKSLRSLTLDEAVSQHNRLSAAHRLATLHPLYVQADALRDPSLHPTFLSWSAQGETWTHAVHLTDVAGGQWRDASSPYGYGGPVSTCNDPAFLHGAWQAYCEWMQSQKVVVEYVRFHPLLSNERLYGGQVQENRSVVSIDLTDGLPEAGYATRQNQAIKKALRMGVTYTESPLAGLAPHFGRFYREAMQAMGTDPFYWFDDGYFQALAKSGMAAVGVCTHPDFGERWLSACLLLDGGFAREYHLAGSIPESRRFSAATLAVHGAAYGAIDRGLRHFYLGGGTDRLGDNPLLFFKAGFSPGRLCYRTGSNVFHAAGYEALKARFESAWRAHPERPIFWRKV